MNEKWGFFDYRWPMIWEETAICDFEAAFQHSSKGQNPQTPQQLAAWLDHSNLDHAPVLVADLTGDGTEDWVLITQLIDRPHRTMREWSIWAILRDDGIPTAISVGSFGIEKDHPLPIHTSLNVLSPDQGMLPVVALTYDDHLRVFQLLNEKPYTVNILLSESRINRVEVHPENQTWTLFFNTPAQIWSFPVETSVDYQWDTYLQNYIPTQTQYSEQDQAIAEIEDLLFSQGQFSAVIKPIQTLLTDQTIEPLESCSSDSGCVSQSVFRPYLTYLLGLAYELQGDEANAVRAYWQLWHDFPDSQYTQVVRAKLR